MASYTETKRLEGLGSFAIKTILDELTRTYSGDPLFLVELKEFIDSLNEEDKSVIYLRYLGLTIEEVAKELEVTDRRIAQRIKGVRERAKKWLG